MLSTCNRTEVYAVAERFHGGLPRHPRLPRASWRSSRPRTSPTTSTSTTTREAVAHLFAVAAGLDSAVLGESEILGQVAPRGTCARDEGAAGPALNLLFRHALEAGKRARTEHRHRPEHHVGLAGRGRAGRRAARRARRGPRCSCSAPARWARAWPLGLAKAGARRRRSSPTAPGTTRRGARRPGRWAGRPPPRGAPPPSPTSTCCSPPPAPQSPILEHDDSPARSWPPRAGRPLLIVDIAVPRDVDPAVGALGGVDAARHGRPARASPRPARPAAAARSPRCATLIDEELVSAYRRGHLGPRGRPADRARSATGPRRSAGRARPLRRATRRARRAPARGRRGRSPGASSPSCCTSRPSRLKDAAGHAPGRPPRRLPPRPLRPLRVEAQGGLPARSSSVALRVAAGAPPGGARRTPASCCATASPGRDAHGSPRRPRWQAAARRRVCWRHVDRCRGRGRAGASSTRRADRRLDVPIWELGRQGRVRQGGAGRGARRPGRPRRPLGQGPRRRSRVAGLVLAAVPERGDPRDALVGATLADLRRRRHGGHRLAPAPGPARRPAAPTSRFVGLRGNMATRLAKVADVDAIVVAAVALERLGLADRSPSVCPIDLRPARRSPRARWPSSAAPTTRRREPRWPPSSTAPAAGPSTPSGPSSPSSAATATCPPAPTPPSADGSASARGSARLGGRPRRAASRRGRRRRRAPAARRPPPPRPRRHRPPRSLTGHVRRRGDRVPRRPGPPRRPVRSGRGRRGSRSGAAGGGARDRGLGSGGSSSGGRRRDRVPGRRRARRPRACSPSGGPSCSRGPTSSSTTGCRWRRCSTWPRRAPSASTWARRRARSTHGAGGHQRAARRAGPRRRQTVVRLKGGDPFVFARGGEEAAALLRRASPSRWCPASPRRIAAPAYAGIPVTLRHSLDLVHGRHRPRGSRRRRRRHGRLGGRRPGRRHDRDPDGRRADRPASPRGSWPGACRRTRRRPRCGGAPDRSSARVRATLATIADQPLASPSVIVVGEVAAEDLAWFERRPLFGRRVVVTRARQQASQLIRGAPRRWRRAPIEVPVIEVAPPDDGGAALRAAAGALGAYDWVVFTSPNGVERLLDAVPDVGARARSGPRWRPSGRAPPRALAGRRHRGRPGPRAVRRRVAARRVRAPPTAGRVLLARAAVARDVLPDGLRATGWERRRGRRLPHGRGGRSPTTQRSAVAGADAITFTSSSTVERFVERVRPGRRAPRWSRASARSPRPRRGNTASRRRRGRRPTPSTAWSSALVAWATDGRRPT